MVGNLGGPPNGAKIDRVVAPDLVLPVLGHHAPMLFVIVIGSKVEPIGPKREAEALGRLFEHAHPFGHDLLADAVAGDDGYPIGLGHDALLMRGIPASIYPTWRRFGNDASSAIRRNHSQDCIRSRQRAEFPHCLAIPAGEQWGLFYSAAFADCWAHRCCLVRWQWLQPNRQSETQTKKRPRRRFKPPWLTIGGSWMNTPASTKNSRTRQRSTGMRSRKNGGRASRSVTMVKTSSWRIMSSPSHRSIPGRRNLSTPRRSRHRRPRNHMCRLLPIFCNRPRSISNLCRRGRKAKLNSSAPMSRLRLPPA